MHRPINPEAVPAPIGGYTHALEVGPGLRWVQISGQIPEAVDATIPDDFERQCNLVWDHVEQCLRAAGREKIAAQNQILNIERAARRILRAVYFVGCLMCTIEFK